MPGREFFLLEIGMGSDWAGLSGPQIVARWRELDTGPEARRHIYDRLLVEHRHLTGAEFVRLYDEHWGLDGTKDYEDSFAVDQALDNPGSPRDMMELLAMIAESRCASPPSCRLMVEILMRQEWRDKIPAGLPPGTRRRQQDRRRGRHQQRRRPLLPARRRSRVAGRVLQGPGRGADRARAGGYRRDRARRLDALRR